MDHSVITKTNWTAIFVSNFGSSLLRIDFHNQLGLVQSLGHWSLTILFNYVQMTPTRKCKFGALEHTDGHIITLCFPLLSRRRYTNCQWQNQDQLICLWKYKTNSQNKEEKHQYLSTRLV